MKTSREQPLLAVEIDNMFEVIKVSKTYEQQLRNYANIHRSSIHFEKNIEYRLERKDRFVGYAVLDIVNDEIAYLSWIDLKMIQLTDAQYKKGLNPEQAYFFDDHCVPKYRRMGLHKRIFYDRINYCVNNNIEEIFIAIMNDNEIAINNLSKFNFNKVMSIGVSPLI